MDSLPVLFVIGAWIASEQAREMAEDIETARLRLRWTRKIMADEMKLTEQQLSNQITLKEPLNIYRLADLPLVFQRTFLVVRAERIDQQVFEDARIAELLSGVQQLVKKRMVRMSTASEQKTERIA